LIDEFA